MRAKHTWVDITTLAAWKGTPTGIPRVTYNLASRYAELSDVSFVVFHEWSRQFREVDGRLILEAIRDDFRGSPSTNSPKHRVADDRAKWSGTGAIVRVMHFVLDRPALRRTAWRVLSHLPRTEARLRRAYARGTGGLNPARGQAQWDTARPPTPRRFANVTRRTRSASFVPGDRVVVLGAGWLSHSFQDSLRTLKSTHGVRIYQVLYDLAPVLLPHSFGVRFASHFTKYFFDAASISDGLIAISRNSRLDALAFCESLLLPEPRIEVFRLGDEDPRVGNASAPIPALEGEEFVLSVGTLELRKNYQLLYQVWRLAAERSLELPRLVIVGKRGLGGDDALLAMTGDPAVKDSITVLETVNDVELEWLMATCLFTIYPSMYEGWGLPIAESLARGKICIASRAGAMPEVAGGLIDYFSPYDAGECLAVVTRHLEPAVRETKERTIAQRFRPTSWDDSFRQFVEAVERIERPPSASDASNRPSPGA